MPKQVQDYTPQELQAIGRKTVEARLKDADKSKEKAQVLSAIYKAWKDGKVEIPGIPKPKQERRKMSLLNEASEKEEGLYNSFQDSLEKYYDWEETSRQEFLASIYPDCEEEEE